MLKNLIDKQFEKLGYKITHCDVNNVQYETEKVDENGSFTHSIHIQWKRNENTFCVYSFDTKQNSDLFYNNVQLTMKEVLLIYLRMWFMR